MKWVKLCTIALVLILHSIQLTASDWSPPNIEVSIGQGQSEVVAVILVANKALEEVSLRVVPELEPFVTVEPSRFSMAKGEAKSFELLFSASVDAPEGVYEGVIQIRKKRTIPKPLDISLTINPTYWNDENSYSVTFPLGWEAHEVAKESVRQELILGSTVLFPSPESISGPTINIINAPLSHYIATIQSTLTEISRYAYPTDQTAWLIVESYLEEISDVSLSAYATINDTTFQIVAHENAHGRDNFFELVNSFLVVE